MVDVDKAQKRLEESIEEAIDISKYQVYVSLIDEVFKKYDFQRLVFYRNTDPWTPGEHYIVKKEKSTFMFIPTTKNIAVAKIVVEPRFVGDTYNSDYGDQPIIKIIYKNNTKVIDAVNEFVNSFKKVFTYEFKIE